MLRKTFVHLIYLLIYYYNFILKICSIDIILKNEELSMEEFALSTKNFSEDIRVICNEPIYYISPYGRNKMNIQSNIFFYSENGTIFDFQNFYKTSLQADFDIADKKIIFKNIIFYNYNDNLLEGQYIVTVLTTTDRFQVQFDNCTFIDNQSTLLNAKYRYTKLTTTQLEPHVLFKDCRFM